MKKNFLYKKTSGFSLIEVLLAVAIMSFGLLALASLQNSLMRSSANSKAQSVALSLAKDKLEDLRTYQTMAQYQALTDSPSAETPDSDPATAGIQDFGGVTYTRTWTVNRYGYHSANAVFQTVADTGVLAAAYASNNEFKTISVNVSWTDAAGTAASVVVEDVISALSPTDSALLGKTTSVVRPRGPEVIITNPGLEVGVIPIALGSDSATAATNPKPEVISQGNNSSVVETRFDVLTYSNINATNVTAQQRVETAVLGCRCTRSTGTQPAFRPTYWNGLRYVPPVTFPNVPISVADTSVTQSARCTACCRDHHDPATAPGPKYDARRNSHDHYLNTDLVNIVTSGDYHESCRLIRVDGIFRTAVDTNNDYFNLLETDNNSATTTADYLPTSAGKTRYETFVLDYLKQRYVNNSAPSTYNTPLTAANIATLEGTPTPSINTPSLISIDATTAPRWLHSRGVYIDYLSDETLALIASIKAQCIIDSCTTAVRQTRILSVLPFTSINLTEISNWKSTVANVPNTVTIKMDNTIGFVDSLNQLAPVKGKTLLGSGPVNGANASAVADIGPSNSGLALTNPIDPADVITNVPDSGDTTDAQAFVIGATVVVPNPAGGSFEVRLAGAPEVIIAGNSPFIGFNPSTSLTNCSATGGTNVNPYVCTTNPADALGVATTVYIGNYNRSVGENDSTVRPLNTCTNNSSDRTGMPYQVKYDVTNVTTSNGAAVIDTPYEVFNNNLLGGYPTGEYTTVDFSVVAVNDDIDVTFGNKVFLCPSNYPFPSNPSSSQCDGNGSNAVPIWSSTYVACPSGFAVPSNP